MIEQLLNLPTPVITLLLLTGLIAAFIVASKVMQMIFETITLAILSGVFYTTLTFLLGGYSFDYNDLLLFSFLGASLYMLYSFLLATLRTAETAATVPLAIILSIYRPIKKNLKKILRKIKRKIRSHGETEVAEKTTKEVVLDKTD